MADHAKFPFPSTLKMTECAEPATASLSFSSLSSVPRRAQRLVRASMGQPSGARGRRLERLPPSRLQSASDEQLDIKRWQLEVKEAKLRRRHPVLLCRQANCQLATSRSACPSSSSTVLNGASQLRSYCGARPFPQHVKIGRKAEPQKPQNP